MKKYLTIILLLTLCFVFKTYGKQGNKTTKKSTKEDMILIVSGEFIMGSTEKKAKEGFELCKKYSDACQWDWFKVEMPQHQVFLDTYYIDKYEVTNAKYKKSCNSVRPCKQNITCEVGSFSSDASSYGVMDMAGNVLEWVSDWYDGNYYENSPENNPTGASSGNYKVLRGGSWYNYNANYLRTAYRNNSYPVLNWISVGLRCVKSSK